MVKVKSKSYEEQLKLLTEHIQESKAIVVGVASGMSAAAGFRHYYERDRDFVNYFGDFENKYGYHNSFDGAYYHYKNSEEHWAFFARLAECLCFLPVYKPRRIGLFLSHFLGCSLCLLIIVVFRKADVSLPCVVFFYFRFLLYSHSEFSPFSPV